MSRAVLISIQPKWCEHIASGQKTVEVRKTAPHIDTPFKCYIYQTKKKWMFNLLRKIGLSDLANKLLAGKGKVIGEFVCDKIGDDGTTMRGRTALSQEEIEQYRQGKPLYYWHISDLVIYDKPRELGEFWVRSNHPDCDQCAHVPVDMSPDEFVWHNDFCGECHRLSYKSMWATHFRKRITRAPQSWMYCQPIEAN